MHLQKTLPAVIDSNFVSFSFCVCLCIQLATKGILKYCLRGARCFSPPTWPGYEATS